MMGFMTIDTVMSNVNRNQQYGQEIIKTCFFGSEVSKKHLVNISVFIIYHIIILYHIAYNVVFEVA